jgi:hypothetical protein
VPSAAAQDDGGSSAAAAQDEADYLFTITGDSGAIEKGAERRLGRRLVVTWDGVSKSTHFFSDRPERKAGRLTTKEFVDSWDERFGDDPPNAALAAQTPAGEEDVVIVEITKADYSPRRDRLTMTARVIGDDESPFLTALDDDDDNIPSTFDRATLFVDGAPLTASATQSVTVNNNSSNEQSYALFAAGRGGGADSLVAITGQVPAGPLQTHHFSFDSSLTLVVGPPGGPYSAPVPVSIGKAYDFTGTPTAPAISPSSDRAPSDRVLVANRTDPRGLGVEAILRIGEAPLFKALLTQDRTATFEPRTILFALSPQPIAAGTIVSESLRNGQTLTISTQPSGACVTIDPNGTMTLGSQPC